MRRQEEHSYHIKTKINRINSSSNQIRKRIIFIFIDGLGLGSDNPESNPLYKENIPTIHSLINSIINSEAHLLGTLFSSMENHNQMRQKNRPRVLVVPLDACLGIEGLPQSATGQASIFTGENAAAFMGRHVCGQPGPRLAQFIRKDNLFKRLKRAGITFINSNVYRTGYLEMIELKTNEKIKPSASSVMTMSSGQKFNTVEDYINGIGIYHDITGKLLSESFPEAPVISPEEAARRLYRLSRDYDFTFFEFFMTDIAGHSKDMDKAAEVLFTLDGFLEKLLRIIDIHKDIVIITSDHGNIEDMSVKTHTINRVPFAAAGDLPEGMLDGMNSLTDILPFIMKLLAN